MEIRERLLALAAGSPIGGATSPGPTDPYDEFEYDKRHIRWSEDIFRFAVISVVLLVLGCAMSGIAYAAQDDMRKPFGSPPPRRSFFPRARDATMGFEYRPVR